MINEQSSDIGNTIIQGSVSFTIVGVLSKALLFILSWVLIRGVFTTDEVGEYNILLNTYVFISSFTFGISSRIVMIKEVSVNSNNFPKLQSIMSSFLVFNLIGTVAVIGYFAITYGFQVIYEPAFLPSLFLLSFAVSEKIATVCGFLLGMKRYKLYNLIQLIMVVSHVIISIFLAFMFKYFTEIPPYYAVFIGMISKSVIGSVLSFISIRKIYGKIITWKCKGVFFKYMKEVFSVGGVYFLDSIIITQSVLLLWSITYDLPIVTAYSLVQKTGTNFRQLISIFLGGMLMSILPTYIQKGDTKEAERITGKVSMVIFILTSMMLFGLTIFSKEFTWIFYGEDNIENPIILWFACFQVLWTVTEFGVKETFITLKKTWVMYAILLIRIGTFFGCVYLLTPLLGLYGMLLSVAISYIIGMTLNYLSMIYIAKMNIIKHYWKFIIHYIFYQTMFCAIYINTYNILWFRVVSFLLLIGIYIYITSKLLLSKSDKNYTMNYIKQIVYKFKR